MERLVDQPFALSKLFEFQIKKSRIYLSIISGKGDEQWQLY